MVLGICSQSASLMATLSSTQAALLSLHSEELNSPLRSFDLTPWDAQVANVMVAQSSPPRIVHVACGMSSGRLFVDNEAVGSGSDSNAPYLYECEFDEFSTEDL